MSWVCKLCKKTHKGCDFITNKHCYEKWVVEVARLNKRRMRIHISKHDDKVVWMLSSVYKPLREEVYILDDRDFLERRAQ